MLPSQTNFLFAAPSFTDGKSYFAALREKNILTRRWDGERIKNYLRITIGTQQQMETLIEVTKELMA